MQMLMRQPAVDGTVKVVSAATATATAEGWIVRTHKSRRREGHVMRVAGRRRRAVAQEQSASVAAPPVAVVGRSRRRPPAAGGRGARVVPIVARRRPYSPAQSLGDKALREAAHSYYSCSLGSNLTRYGVKRGPLGRAQEYQMSTKMRMWFRAAEWMAAQQRTLLSHYTFVAQRILPLARWLARSSSHFGPLSLASHARLHHVCTLHVVIMCRGNKFAGQRTTRK